MFQQLLSFWQQPIINTGRKRKLMDLSESSEEEDSSESSSMVETWDDIPKDYLEDNTVYFVRIYHSRYRGYIYKVGFSNDFSERIKGLNQEFGANWKITVLMLVKVRSQKTEVQKIHKELHQLGLQIEGRLPILLNLEKSTNVVIGLSVKLGKFCLNMEEICFNVMFRFQFHEKN